MKAVLHIGDQKSGSKSIQSLLLKNEDLFLSRGFYLPKATKQGVYDMGLSAYAGKPKSVRAFSQSQDIQPQPPAVRKHIRRKLTREIAATDAETCVFSFEGLLHLHQEGIFELRRLLDDLFTDTRIIVFIRRQDRKAMSSYTTRLLQGGTPPDPLMLSNEGPLGLPKHSSNFNYLSVVMFWLQEFTRDRVRVIRFEDCPDVATTFLGELGVASAEGFDLTRANESLSATGQDIVLTFNRTVSKRPAFETLSPGKLKTLRQEVRARYPGKGRLISERRAREFYANFAEDNRMLNAVLGRGAEDFFDDDFSRYPAEEPRTGTVDPDEVERIFLDALAATDSRS